jgi:hypothetical protein
MDEHLETLALERLVCISCRLLMMQNTKSVLHRKIISCTATNRKSDLELPCQNTTDGFEIFRKQFYTDLYSGFLSVSLEAMGRQLS